VTAYTGVGRVLSSAEVDAMCDELNEGWSSREANLIFTVQQREGALRWLYNAVLATPLEGDAVRAAMRNAEKTLGLTGHPATPE
jgi:hypothetical protein